MARKILLADDSVTAQNMGRKILADAGYEVATVNNGSAALKRIAEHKPDLIVLDVYMPGYSGLEVCQRLKESNETSRIPVLLTVGKLEPFKPEEAQRVRAEGFIVKPFEASELLSALSRLEDKVVPRPEPSKPGRFARAMAAVEEASRAGDDASWKERLSFPGKKKKAEAEPKVQDDAAIYNPVNRDLRTVVEKPVEAEPKPQEVARVKPAGGMPEDVTPEELAAIAAAMAQMQGSWADAQTAEQLVARALTTNAADRLAEQAASSTQTLADAKAESAPVEARADVVGDERTESLPASAVTSTSGIAAESVASATGLTTEEKIEVAKEMAAEEVPATMAAAAAAAASTSSHEPRWMAVPVSIASEESAISLEREMQAAYAAFSAAEANQPGFAAPAEAEPVLTQNSVLAEAVAEPVVVTPRAPEPERAMSSAVVEPPSTPVAPSPETVAEAAVVASAIPSQEYSPTPFPANIADVPSASEHFEAPTAPSELPPPVALEAQPSPVAAPSFATPAEAALEPADEPVASHFTAPVAEMPIPVASSAQADPVQEEAPIHEQEPQIAQAAADHSDSQAAGHEASVATTAAAWANWRQIRDAGDATDKNDDRAAAEREAGASAASQAESAAMAVAAGAEKIVQEASAASPNADPIAIANIVESVLADLRPKIVEEISKKLSGDKK